MLIASLTPLSNQHHIINSQQVVELIKDQRVEEDEELRSYDMSAFFTSVTVDKARDIVWSRLEGDNTLKERTELNLDQIVWLAEGVSEAIFFGEYYEQLNGAAIGLPFLRFCVTFIWRMSSKEL